MWSKLLTAIRGGAYEAGQAAVDSQALRILDQEIRDAHDELSRSKDGLAEIIANQKLAEEKASSLDARIVEYTQYAKDAIAKDDDALALEVAEKLADLESQREVELDSAASYKASADDLREAIRGAEANIKRVKQQADTVKATESVQKAQAIIAERHSGTDSRLRTATESLERIKERQAMSSARMKASKEIAHENRDVSLEQKLEKAGIKPGASRANEILERLKKS